ncbi:hypothetical protein ACFV9C_41455 [Kribbella sp. NPDC059898]|uniref:hypothetical protein n=1 Tax=Kribbella sp. NPDC059898 TaxID=3346995 RepID=UPI0036555880
MTTILEMQQPAKCRVRVWFGEHVIADYTSDPEEASDYYAAMTRRFAGLRVTIEPVGELVDAVADDDASDS